jgi:hypothetical protein
MKDNKRKRDRFAKNSLIFLVVCEVVLGGIIDVTSKHTADISEVITEDSRDLDMIFTSPLIITEPNKATEPTQTTPKDGETTYALTEETEDIKDLSSIYYYSDTADRIYATFDFLMSEGFSTEAAAGVIGNMAVESNFNPYAVNSLGYKGLFQWNSNESGGFWFFDIVDWMNDNQYPKYSFEGQVKAMLYCPNRGLLNDKRLEELKSLKNVEQAAELFAVYYEGCIGGNDPTQYYRLGNNYQDLKLRKSEALVAYQMFITDSHEYTGQRAYNAN